MNDIRDLLPAYAIGAVDPDERARIEAALATHPELRDELASFAPIIEALALSVPQIAPPPDLGEKILRRATSPLAFPWRRFLAVAAVFVVILGGVLVWQLLQEDTPDDDPQTRQIEAIMENPDSLHIVLTGMQENEQFAAVHGELVVAPGHDRAVLHLSNLPHPENKHYQLWFARENTPVSAAVFTPETASPQTPLLIELPDNFASYERMGITVEPIGGSPAPTGDAVLRAELQLSPEE